MFPNAKFTFTIKELQDDYKFDIFSFDYKFYCEEHKLEFECLFLDRFRYREIGFNTIEEFQRRLQNKLNTMYPYYLRVWDFELKSRNIDYLNNKDLNESFERIIDSDSITNEKGQLLSTSQNTLNSLTTTNNKQSNLNNVNANISTSHLTNIMVEDSNNKEQNEQNNNTTNNLNSNVNNKLIERTTLKSKGNIGTTSSGELKMKAIESIINIDEMILEDLECLFLGVY